MRSLALRGRTVDRSFPVRFFDVLVRSMVAIAAIVATLMARLGFSDIGPLAIAVRPAIPVQSVRAYRRPRRLLTLELGSALADVPSGQSAS